MESLLIKPEHHDDKYREMSPSTCQLDTIHLRNLRLSAVIGPDAWNRYNKPQPIVLTIQLQIDTTAAGASDNLNDSFSYSQICKDITAKVDGKKFVDIDDLTYELTRLAGGWPGKTLKIQAMVPKGMLRVEGGFGRVLFLQRVEAQTHGLKTSNWRLGNHEWLVQGLKLACIIGVNPHERIEIQALNINLRIIGEADAANYALQIIHENYGAWRRLVKRVCEVVEVSSFDTLEALCTLIAKTALEGFPVLQIIVYAEKPSALPFVDGAGVEISRDRRWLQSLQS